MFTAYKSCNYIIVLIIIIIIIIIDIIISIIIIINATLGVLTIR